LGIGLFPFLVFFPNLCRIYSVATYKLFAANMAFIHLLSPSNTIFFRDWAITVIALFLFITFDLLQS